MNFVGDDGSLTLEGKRRGLVQLQDGSRAMVYSVVKTPGGMTGTLVIFPGMPVEDMLTAFQAMEPTAMVMS